MTPIQNHILITRPIGQHHRFSTSLQALGMKVSHLPCLSIEALPSTALNQNPALNFDSVLFTSVNAVQCAHALRPLPWSGLAVHAIGAATCKALQQLGQSLSMTPQLPFNSEAYLQQLEQHNPGHLLLVKGEGGRTLIASRLRKSGWQVSTLELYRRQLPKLVESDIARIFKEHKPDILSVTSNEVLNNLVILARNYLDDLRHIPIVVNSQRAIPLVRAHGFTHSILVANPPGDQGQLLQVRQWLSSDYPNSP